MAWHGRGRQRQIYLGADSRKRDIWYVCIYQVHTEPHVRSAAALGRMLARSRSRSRLHLRNQEGQPRHNIKAEQGTQKRSDKQRQLKFWTSGTKRRLWRRCPDQPVSRHGQRAPDASPTRKPRRVDASTCSGSNRSGRGPRSGTAAGLSGHAREIVKNGT